ncbi:oxygen-insensitive NADPH nitroreductase [Clostridium sp. YIM B02515]|uniref:Oxygen-insensitive NADPH nitroreductase n=1 Tax=Clostridium rhizosphaerae TaxID=2803861 RepID=A0ABS1T7S0_9CLOT|nr:oxygen-insensitive NADPH nitroreductase [Clostridium rhizosphaerae]MBL4935387.1 oxygen-insensitive NADPH nitroreductase [Clostridium rhizosphaerae]
MNETINLIKSHKSIRKYLNKPVKDNIIKEIISSAQAASTSSFMQAYTIINVMDIEKRNTIRILSGDQTYIEECPLFLVFCADLHKFEIAGSLNSEQIEQGYTEAFIIATVDTALAAQNAMLAAESLGLGGVYIGGIRNNPNEISKLLELPDNVYAVFGMCLGYPADNPETKLRLPLDAVCCTDKYDIDSKIDLIKQYDKKISDYYIERTNALRSDTWTRQMAKHMSKPLRPHMKEFLDRKGFLKK